MKKLQTRTCMIIDATYSPGVEEDLDSEEQLSSSDKSFLSEYSNSVVLLLQDVDTFNTFHCPLSAQDIKELTNLKSEPTPRELIKFAEALRSREAPVTLLASKDSEEITPDMIKQLQRKGLLTSKESLKKYEAAKAKQKGLIEEQENIPDEEYEKFMEEQDAVLQEKFALWREEQKKLSKQSVFLELDNIDEE
jgi:hypothetical protein